jgi:hypothetical protein
MASGAGGSYLLRKVYQKYSNLIQIKYAMQIGPLAVWVVNGMIIRNKVWIDFTEGGNSMAYIWMPPDTIWLDTDVSPEEQRYVLLHELSEYNGMRWLKMDYDPAHIRANTFEQDARDHPDRFDQLFKTQKDIMIDNSKGR